MELMGFLKGYQESICNVSSDVLPNTKPHIGDEPEDTTGQLTASEIWPVAKAGPKKGKIIPRRDLRGNIVIDPAGNIEASKYLLDYNIYEMLHK